MDTRFLFPPAASVEAEQVDRLFYVLLGIGGMVVGAVAILIVVFAVRYRQANAVDRRLDRSRGRWLEYAWIGLPLLLFMGFFSWGAILYVDLHRPPADALTIYGIGKQWMWKFEHPGGQREINELHVPSGRPVHVVLASQDVIHSFFVPAFRIKQDAVPGYLTSTWFTATRHGDYHLFCAEYCGTQHSGMIGRVRVLSPERYQEWLESEGPVQSLASQGRRLFRDLGCDQCHAFGAATAAPPLNGLFGTVVALRSGERVRADETYLRTALLEPDAQVTAGYDPIMPSYADQLDEPGLFRLIAYLKTLGHEEPQEDLAQPSDEPR